MNLRTRILVPSGLLLGVVVGSACTAILAPRDDVQRCGTATDCDPTGDARYVAECRFDPDNVNLDSTEIDKICVATFKKISCDPMAMLGNEVYQTALETYGEAARYTACDSDPAVPAVQGCPLLGGGTCAEGLSENADGLCDDSDDRTPPAKNIATNAEYVGQDIRDQFCRSFFCRGDFVCDSEDFTCVPCDPDAAYGEGGCGEIYVSGAPSCIYLQGDAIDDACDAPDSELESVSFGACG